MTSEPEIRAQAFWDFCLTVYAQPGISEACLRLQDDCGADVPSLLYVLWLATQGRLVRKELLSEICATTGQWSSAVVQPLRSVRRHLKGKVDFGEIGSVSTLRENLKMQELAAERIQITWMATCFPAEWHDRSVADAGTATSNLTTYLKSLGASPDPGELEVFCCAIAASAIAAEGCEIVPTSLA